jgi:aryl-alcohol dehydrogenase-like predicted oxidoreductase
VWAGPKRSPGGCLLFLKFVIRHPAVTVTTPATSRARHMIDNMGARGELPDEATIWLAVHYD